MHSYTSYILLGPAHNGLGQANKLLGPCTFP